MMIPTEMPCLSQPRGENGHGNSHFGEAPSVFQNAEQLMRSQLFGQQLPAMGSDQMQMLQSLQQIGQKQKEVKRFQLYFLIMILSPTGRPMVFCLVKGTGAKKGITYSSFFAFSGAKQDADRLGGLCPQGGPTACAGAAAQYPAADPSHAAGGKTKIFSNSAANAEQTAAINGPTSISPARHHAEHAGAE